MCFSNKSDQQLSALENITNPLSKTAFGLNKHIQSGKDPSSQYQNTTSIPTKEDLLNHNPKQTQYSTGLSKGFVPVDPGAYSENNDNERNSSFKRINCYYYDNMIIGKNIFDKEALRQDDIVFNQPTILQSTFIMPKTEMINKKKVICYTDSNDKLHLTNYVGQNDEVDLGNRTVMKSCTCTKTKCLKKYCECYANNKFCINCNCKDCENNPAFKTSQMKEMNEIITCTCTKSNCNKKYCACYKGNKRCNDQCRCINCINKQNIYKGLQMQRISVLIQHAKIYIEITEVKPFSLPSSSIEEEEDENADEEEERETMNNTIIGSATSISKNMLTLKRGREFESDDIITQHNKSPSNFKAKSS